MTEAEFQHTTTLVLALAFAIGVLFGAIGQRTRFCTMGAITDMAVMGDPGRLRMWLVAAGVAILGFNALAALDLVHAADSIYAAPRLLLARTEHGQIDAGGRLLQCLAIAAFVEGEPGG